jgi:hypothetical protein
MANLSSFNTMSIPPSFASLIPSKECNRAKKSSCNANFVSEHGERNQILKDYLIQNRVCLEDLRTGCCPDSLPVVGGHQHPKQICFTTSVLRVRNQEFQCGSGSEY